MRAIVNMGLELGEDGVFDNHVALVRAADLDNCAGFLVIVDQGVRSVEIEHLPCRGPSKQFEAQLHLRNVGFLHLIFLTIFEGIADCGLVLD